ncbi:MAG: beta-galactosidase [Phycisphaeraceae bacterium]
MTTRFPPTKLPHILHGGDYNPEQWLHDPKVLDEDVRLMKLARCNFVSLGIFSWAMLEPEEGRYDFAWMDGVMDRLADAGISVNLATPSGGKPNWMGIKYPEIRRVNELGQRDLQRHRHNHCYTSPVYRQKVTQINTKLAQHYKDHPALILWHVSNEYSGMCHCDLCKAAFRQWLKKRYGTLEKLNIAWWSTFWSHRYSDWEQINAIDVSVHGLTLDWRRFTSDQTTDFMRNEVKPLKEITPDVPVTTNMMGTCPDNDYWKLATACDVVSWDAYPEWSARDDWRTAVSVGFGHDLTRSLLGKPFLLMESTPSQVNWKAVSPLKRPGVHKLTSLLAVAHGADMVGYFQWRKSRGSSEKFHGAVVDHVGHENTRVFRDVADLGQHLSKLYGVVGTPVPAQAAVIYDWENRWALEAEQGPRNSEKNYELTCMSWYESLWKRNIAADVINMDQDLSKYKLLIAPMLYMVRQGVGERIAKFVEAGGSFIATYFSGLVNETDLCFLTGFPGPLRPTLGIWVEETDVLGPDMPPQTLVASAENGMGLTGDYPVQHYCDLLHIESKQARPLATYGHDFYAGRPAATVNNLGQGKAYYVAARTDARFIDDFIAGVAKAANLTGAIAAPTPLGVSVQKRSDGKTDYLFLLNFTRQQQQITLDPGQYHDPLTNQPVQGDVMLAPLGCTTLQKRK